MTTGDRLWRAIERKLGKGVTQVKAAEHLGVSTGNLSEWLNDKYEPTLDSLRGIAERLECSVASLIGDEKAAS